VFAGFGITPACYYSGAQMSWTGQYRTLADLSH